MTKYRNTTFNRALALYLKRWNFFQLRYHSVILKTLQRRSPAQAARWILLQSQILQVRGPQLPFLQVAPQVKALNLKGKAPTTAVYAAHPFAVIFRHQEEKYKGSLSSSSFISHPYPNCPPSWAFTRKAFFRKKRKFPPQVYFLHFWKGKKGLTMADTPASTRFAVVFFSKISAIKHLLSISRPNEQNFISDVRLNHYQTVGIKTLNSATPYTDIALRNYNILIMKHLQLSYLLHLLTSTTTSCQFHKALQLLKSTGTWLRNVCTIFFPFSSLGFSQNIRNQNIGKIIRAELP